ncbi:MAG: hypothetical protein NUV98_04165, partial [Candidatus Roizmanbacteria bacterium]|nr:hypothetical protein [Candidatus Roizmanbacteria bacterium]
LGEGIYYYLLTNNTQIVPVALDTTLVKPQITPTAVPQQVNTVAQQTQFIYLNEGQNYESVTAKVVFRGTLIELRQENNLIIKLRDEEKAENNITTLGFTPAHIERITTINTVDGSQQPFDTNSLSINDDIRVTMNINFLTKPDQLVSVTIEKIQ